MNRRNKHTGARFREGSRGGCEALLYEFRDWSSPEPTDISDERRPIVKDVGTVLIAATKFEDAFLFLRKSRPDYRVRSVRCFGLIELFSGSPLN
jgi:hypothetical protein